MKLRQCDIVVVSLQKVGDDSECIMAAIICEDVYNDLGATFSRQRRLGELSLI